MRLAFWLLALLTFLSLALRLPQLRASLWVDELHTAWVVADRFEEVAPRALLGNQSPLYFYGAWATTRVTGLSELALRLPSLLAGAALGPLAFVVVHRWTKSHVAALLAALLAAVDRDFLFYAVEARPYALVQVAALVRLAVFTRLLGSPTRARRAAYVAVAGLMFHLHYTTALLWPGEAAVVAWLAFLRPRCEYGARPFLVDSALLALLCLPAAPHMLEIYARRDNWAAFIPQPSATASFLERVFRRVLPMIVSLAAPLTVLLLSRAWRKAEGEKPRHDSDCVMESERLPGPRLLLTAVVWTATPVFAAWLLATTDVARLLLYRYLIGSAAAVPVLAGLLCGLCPTRTWRAAAASVTALAILSVAAPDYLAQLRHDGRFLSDRREDWRAAVQFVNCHDDRLPVFLDAGLIEASDYADSADPRRRDYCLLPVLSLYRLEPPDRTQIPLAAPRLTTEHVELIASRKGAWLLLRTPPQRATRALAAMERQAARQGQPLRVQESRAFGTVTAARVSS